MPRLSTLVALFMMLAGCGAEQAPTKPGQVVSVDPGPGADPAPSLTPVSLTLNWTPETEHGGFYAALVHGYYEEAGLKVEIQPGGPGVQVGVLVAKGDMTFGIDNADPILMNRANGMDVVGLFASMQTSPRCLVVHEASDIKSFDDLKNVTLSMKSSSPWAMFVQQKLPLEGVQVVPYNGNLATFLNDPKMVTQGYLFSEPVLAAEKGEKTRSLLVSELGYNPYTSVLVTRGELIQKDPELVRKMVQATSRGWIKYLEDPESTNRKIHELNPEMSLRVLAEGVTAMKPLCFGDSDDPKQLGRMSPERWKTLAGQLVDIKAVKEGSVEPEKAFTTEFLAK